ncbi:MAG: outer membrane lipoprotein carrier protein LolA [Prolixibacteraceae bacterium]|nr:outer membrane lipoprotein carrier protein LolA [Prolixibacteraceae bacterium]MBN2649419.1 outer membrane lipoprotein carrier protein LolA [Prolixibacteraceae bacterium]
MKKIFFIALLSALVISVFSQNEQKAKEILDIVSEKTQSFNSITADFDFVMENAEVDLKETNSGNIIIQNNKYKLVFNGIEIYNNGKNQWTYMPDAEEVNISEVIEDENDYMNPANIFTIYEKGFQYNYKGLSPSRENFIIELSPENINEFSLITLKISQDSYQINKAIMTGTDGNTYIISIKNFKTEQKYPESTFAFDTKKHPSVNVIDLR